MSKPVKRKITVTVSPKPKSLTKNRPSVFERLGTKTGTSSLHKEYCHHWSQNGTCPFGKTCKYSSTHTLISPSKQRAAKKESESKKRHTKDNAHQRLPPAPGQEEWDHWDPEELADADPDDLEKRRQELQRELEIQMKMDTKASKKDKKTKRESSPSESSSTSETSSSTESSSSSTSSTEARKRKAKKIKKRDTSSSSDCDRKKHKITKAIKHPGSNKVKLKTDKIKKPNITGKTKAIGARSPTPVKLARKESRTPPLKAKCIPVMRKKSVSRSPRPLSRDKKEKHRSPSPRERDQRDKERDREREQRERDKERDKEKERIMEKEREREKERDKDRLKAKELRDKDILKKKDRSPAKRTDDRKRRDSPERKVSPSRSRNGSNSGRRDIHKSPTRDEKRHGGSDYGSTSKRASGKDNGSISSSSDKQPRKDTAIKRDHFRDDREREREQLREQREQRERERRIAREEREAAREKEREEALARCQERQRERERIKAEQLRKAAEEELKRKELQIQRRRDDGRDRGLDKPSGDRVERLLPLPAERPLSGSRRSSTDRDRLGVRDRDRRDRSPFRNRSTGRKSVDRHDSGSRVDHHPNRKDADYDSRDHRGSDRSDPGRDYPMRILDDRDHGRHHRIDDVGKQGRYGSPYDEGRSRSHLDDRRGPDYGDGGCYGDNARDLRLPPSLLDHHSGTSGSDDHRRRASRDRDRDHWDERDKHMPDRDIDQHRRYTRDDQSRQPIQPIVTLGGAGVPPPQQQSWPPQTAPGQCGGEFGVALQGDVPIVALQGLQMPGDDWADHQQQSRGIVPRSNRPMPIEWDQSTMSRDNRDWDREQALQQPPTLDQQQHIVGGSGSAGIGHFAVGGDNWQQGVGAGGGVDDVHVGGRGNRRWFGRNDDWRDRGGRSDRDKGRGVGSNVGQRDDSHQDRRKDNISVKQESEPSRTSTLLSVPLEPTDDIKKETLLPLKRPAEQPLVNTTDVKKPCIAAEEPLADDLSEISDDADEILNRDEEIVKDDIIEVNTDLDAANNDNHPSPAQLQIQEEAKEQRPLLVPNVPHSPSKKNQLISAPQRSASPIRFMKGESSVPDDDHMVDNATMDFEEISEDELEEETRVKGLGDALGVDWASLVAESRPRVKPVTSAKRRWEPHNVLINLGISVEYAGEELVKKIFQLHYNEQLQLEKGELKMGQEASKPPSNSANETICSTTQELNNDITKTIKQEKVDSSDEITTIKEEPLEVSNSSLEDGVTVKAEPEDNKENEPTDESKIDNGKADVEVEISHPVALIQVAMRNKIAIKKSLFASAGPNRRALSARRDLAIRRHLCNLPISDAYVEAPRRHDPDMFRTAMELFAKCL